MSSYSVSAIGESIIGTYLNLLRTYIYFLKLPDSAIVPVCFKCSVHFLRKSQVNNITCLCTLLK